MNIAITGQKITIFQVINCLKISPLKLIKDCIWKKKTRFIMSEIKQLLPLIN